MQSVVVRRHELTAGILGKAADPAAIRRQRTAAHPIGRLGQPEDIAGLVVYLASDESSWMTGAILPVERRLLARCDRKGSCTASKYKPIPGAHHSSCAPITGLVNP